jgi:hypothetical protein
MLSLLLLGFLASGVRAAPQDDIAAAWEMV